MQIAKERVGEFQDIFESATNKERILDGLKPAINNLLQMYLPENITIIQAEALGCVISDMIEHPEAYLKPA